MRKQEAIDWAGSVAQLAQRLNVTVQAVYAWGDEIPRLREFEIRELQIAERQEREANAPG
jgi:hypothetical protein